MNHQTILSHLLAAPNSGVFQAKIFYGRPNKASDSAKIIIVPHDGDDFSAWLLSLGQTGASDDFSAILPENLPVQKENGRIICSLDMLQLSRFFLTRQEEITRRNVRDQHGRFLGKESMLYRAGCLARPIVDEYGALLQKWLRETGEDMPAPPGRIDKIYLTHDVDIPYLWRRGRSYVKATMIKAFKDPMHVFDPLLACIGVRGKDPYDCFDWIQEQDKRLQQVLGHDRVESIFFFMAGGTAPQDGNYDIRSPRVRKLMDRLQKGGATIGLHASYEAGMNPELVVKEAQTLREVTGLPVTKNRHHFLSCREPEHLRYLADAGITDDFSLAYADHAGFRTGTCRPYKWIDPLTGEKTNLTIHPLTMMECTLDRPEYMNLDYNGAHSVCSGLLERVRTYNGEAVLLWHNTQLAGAQTPNVSYHPQLYLDMLNWLMENAG